MKSRRVLACAFTCCPPATPGFTGGEDVLGWNLVQQISRFHEVWVLTHAEDRQSIEGFISEKPIDDLHFHYVGLPRWLKPLLKFQGGHQFYYYLWQINAYLEARRLHRKLGFELFHHITYANDWMANFIGALLPVVYVRGPGGGAHQTPKGLAQEYTFGGRVWERVRSLGQWLFRHDPIFVKGQARASAILVCNHESMSNLPESWSHKAHLFPVSGVSSEDLAPTNQVEPQNREFQVVSAGSLIRVKGFGLAINAFKYFSDKHPEAKFNIIGSGPERTRLMALIHRFNLDDKVSLIPQMPRDCLMETMRFHDVFLFPSLRDGGGTVVIEAMAAGKPVVCLDIGGPGINVTDECGIKITPKSPEETVRELAQALERLYLDRELRLRLGRAGHKRAKEMYHWDKLGERLMGIYSSIELGEPVNDQR